MDIIVKMRSVDGFTKTGKFKTLEGARKFAQKWVGETPEFGRGIGEMYAVSWDGVSKVTVSGASLRDLFPQSE
jgi:hypothetical protein